MWGGRDFDAATHGDLRAYYGPAASHCNNCCGGSYGYTGTDQHTQADEHPEARPTHGRADGDTPAAQYTTANADPGPDCCADTHSGLHDLVSRPADHGNRPATGTDEP